MSIKTRLSKRGLLELREDTIGYTPVRNPSLEPTFEILKLLPEVPPTLYEQFDSNTLHRLVERHPNATLQQLCEVVKKERRIVLTPQSMCKVLLRVGLSRKVRRQLQARRVRRMRHISIA